MRRCFVCPLPPDFDPTSLSEGELVGAQVAHVNLDGVYVGVADRVEIDLDLWRIRIWSDWSPPSRPGSG